MNLEAYQTILDDISLDSDKNYLTLQMPIYGMDIDEKKLFCPFESELGSRYWFRSKEGAYNIVGIGYLESIRRDKYSSSSLSKEKDALYDKIQKVMLEEEAPSRLSLFGGTRFDTKDTTDEWNDFAMVEFHLPKWQFDLKNEILFYTADISEVNLQTVLGDIVSELESVERDRKSTRLNSSQVSISFDV